MINEQVQSGKFENSENEEMMKWVYELMKDMSWKISIDWSFHVGIARLMEALNLIQDELKLEKHSKSIPKAF